MKYFKFLLFSFCCVLVISSCATTKVKNIEYLNPSDTIEDKPTLNVYSPRKVEEKKPVLIYIHGGNWNSGSKELYWWFGRNFAKKEVVTVIPGYTLSPEANYDTQTQQIAKAIQWTIDNIADYGGDNSKIYVTGHSAGGHLGALAVMNPKYEIEERKISGIILNDAAGLDMHNYLTKNLPTEEDNYITTWTKDPEVWKEASPIYFISEATPPMMIYVGTKTYPSIKEANTRFLGKLHKVQPAVAPIYLDKKHVPMITQYLFPWSDRFKEIIDFLK